MPKKVDEASKANDQDLMNSEAASEMLADDEAMGVADDSDAIVREIAASIGAESADESPAAEEVEKPAAPPRRRRSNAARAASESEPAPEAEPKPAEEPASEADFEAEAVQEEAAPEEDVSEEAASEEAESEEAAAPPEEPAATEEAQARRPRRRTASTAPKRDANDNRMARIRREVAMVERREESEAMASIWQTLYAARRQNIVLQGKVFSIDREYREDPKTHQQIPEAMVNVFIAGVYDEPLTTSPTRRAANQEVNEALYAKQIKVTIPFTTEFYRTIPLDMSDIDLTTEDGRRSYIHNQELMARKLLQGNQMIPFCITNMERDQGDQYDGEAVYAIAGSRRRALPILSSRIFEPRHGSPVIKEGDNVETTVISVGSHSVQVTCAGVDTIIPNYRLTFKQIDNFKNVFYNGQKLKLKATHIRKREDGSFAMVLSGREVELEDARKRAPKIIHVGSIVHGTFTQISQREDGRCTAIAWLDGVDVPAFVNTFAPRVLGNAPISGDEANLIVTGFHERGFVLTNCSGILGSPSRFMRSLQF